MDNDQTLVVCLARTYLSLFFFYLCWEIMEWLTEYEMCGVCVWVPWTLITLTTKSECGEQRKLYFCYTSDKGHQEGLIARADTEDTQKRTKLSKEDRSQPIIFLVWPDQADRYEPWRKRKDHSFFCLFFSLGIRLVLNWETKPDQDMASSLWPWSLFAYDTIYTLNSLYPCSYSHT